MSYVIQIKQRRWLRVGAMFLGVGVMSSLRFAFGASAGWTDDWTVYRSDDYGFSFSYPSNWHLYEQVRTRYIDKGLPAVFNLCLTSGAVKTVHCDVEFYVIPVDKFVPPVSGFFLGFPSEKIDTYSTEPSWGVFRGEPFYVTDPASGPPNTEGSTNHVLKLNGYLFLWADHGDTDVEEPWNSMIRSFQFYLPALRADPH